jgi:hypothetical protein
MCRRPEISSPTIKRNFPEVKKAKKKFDDGVGHMWVMEKLIATKAKEKKIQSRKCKSQRFHFGITQRNTTGRM